MPPLLRPSVWDSVRAALAPSERPAPPTAVPATPSELPASETVGAGSEPTSNRQDLHPNLWLRRLPTRPCPAPSRRHPRRRARILRASGRVRPGDGGTPPRWRPCSWQPPWSWFWCWPPARAPRAANSHHRRSRRCQQPCHGLGNVEVRLNGDRPRHADDDGAGQRRGARASMHIHAGGKGECPPASAARLHNGHLTISTGDGINYYGPPVQALTTRGDTSPTSISRFPAFRRAARSTTRARSRCRRASSMTSREQCCDRRARHRLRRHRDLQRRAGQERSRPGSTRDGDRAGPLRCSEGPVAECRLDRPSKGHGLLYTASLAANAWLRSPVGESLLCHAPEATAVQPRRQTGTELAAQSQAAA